MEQLYQNSWYKPDHNTMNFKPYFIHYEKDFIHYEKEIIINKRDY